MEELNQTTYNNLLMALFPCEEIRDFEGNVEGYDYFYTDNKRGHKNELLNIWTWKIVRKVEGYKVCFSVGNIVVSNLSDTDEDLTAGL